jgi:glycosyltransferase involved in cell wall biosynthesis
MPSQVSVIIPALNEAESIGAVVSSMPWEQIAECIVVDNGSSDGTGEIAAAGGARVIKSPRGYGRAVNAGSEAALASSTILVYMDGDGDFVIGSRIRGVREPGSMLASQLFAAFLMSWLTRIVYGFRYTDMGPFRAIRRSSLEEMHMTEMTYGWNLEMQLKAVQLGLRVREIPVNYKRRTGGESKVSGNLKASIEAGRRIFGIFLRVRREARK